MQYDVSAIEKTSTGDVVTSRTRLKAISISHASAGTVVLRNGSSSAATLFSYTAPAAAGEVYMLLPGEGILFNSGIHATLTNATITAVYG